MKIGSSASHGVDAMRIGAFRSYSVWLAVVKGLSKLLFGHLHIFAASQLRCFFRFLKGAFKGVFLVLFCAC